MAINLSKGQKISLTKENDGLNVLLVGLGWDPVVQKKGFFAPKAKEVDCDASVLMLKNGCLVSKEDLVYYGNLKHRTGAVTHLGDNLTGDGAGDDEQILLELAKMPADYDKLVFAVNIYQASQRNQNFGMIRNAFCRIVDSRNNQELCRYNLTENYEGLTAMIFGEIYRHQGEWKFNAIGQGTTDPDLSKLTERYLK